MLSTRIMKSSFEDDAAARKLLEDLRWPKGAVCPRCAAQKSEVALIGGEKHREGLYQCKRCRKSFTVTVGTAFERLRIPLSTWVRAAREFSYRDRKGVGKPTLVEIRSALQVNYRTVLRMRDVIEKAAANYRGYKHVFGTWPADLMHHKRLKREETINSDGVLKKTLPPRKYKEGEVDRTERLLRLLLSSPKLRARSRRQGPTKPTRG
jgi:transposase-like protein